jgi:hypothetical protein
MVAARNAKLTPEQRKASATRAITARWARRSDRLKKEAA